MDLSFNRVDYEGDLADFGEDDLRELITEYEEAQESNVAEFERAVESVDEMDESTIEDFEQAREELIEEITEAETFGDVPLSADSLENCDFSELREWEDFVAEDEADNETNESNEGDFDDFGQKAPVDDEGDESDFAEDALNEMQGLNL